MMLVNSTPESLLTKSVPIVVAGAIFGTVYGQVNGLIILGFSAGAFVSLLLTLFYAGVLKQKFSSHAPYSPDSNKSALLRIAASSALCLLNVSNSFSSQS